MQPAAAQGTVLQSGPMIPGDLAKFIANGVIADSGISATSSTLGFVKSVQFAGDGIVDDATPLPSPPCVGDCVLTATPLTQTAGTFLAPPASGGAALPSFRSIVCGEATGLALWPSCNQSWGKSQRGSKQVVALATSTFTPDFDAAQHFTFNLVHASCPCTIANPTNVGNSPGQVGVFKIVQSATGGDTVTFGTDFIYDKGVPPVLSSTGNAIDYLPYYVDDATHIVLALGAANAHH